MDINWYGQSMFRIKGKSATIIIDPFSSETGLKLPNGLEAEIVLITHQHPDHNNSAVISGTPLLIAGPGEYEKAGVTVSGIESFHDNKEGSERGKNTIYNIFIDGVNVVHLGDLGHKLTDEQIQLIENTDILMVPVGSVYTIDAEMAVKVVAQLEAKIVIPMHYKLPDLKYELEGVAGFLKEIGAENLEPTPKLTITKDKLPEETTTVVLSKS